MLTGAFAGAGNRREQKFRHFESYCLGISLHTLEARTGTFERDLPCKDKEGSSL
jgi:hypothetical protein